MRRVRTALNAADKFRYLLAVVMVIKLLHFSARCMYVTTIRLWDYDISFILLHQYNMTS